MARSNLSKLASGLALAIVAVVVIRYYAPWLAPAEVRGYVSKSLGAAQSLLQIVCICTMASIWLKRVAGPIMLAAAYAAWEEGQGIVCPVWYIFEPWTIPQGAAMCSARAGYEFGLVGAAVAAGVVWLIYRWSNRHE